MRHIEGQQALRTAEAAEYLGVSDNTLRYWRYVGQGPKSFKVGERLVYYRKEDLEAWLDDQYKKSVTA